MKTLFEKNTDSCEFDSDPDNGQNNSSIHINVGFKQLLYPSKVIGKAFQRTWLCRDT